MSDFLAGVWRSITHRTLTYLLSLLALSIGVVAFLTIGATGEALYRFQTKQLQKFLHPQIDVSVTVKNQENSDSLEVPAIEGLIEKLTRTADVAPRVSYAQIRMKMGRRWLSWVELYAISSQPSLDGYFALAGRPINSADVKSAAAVCAINQELAQALFPAENPVGKPLLLLGHPLTIVGIVENQADPEVGEFINQVPTAVIPLSYALQTFRRQPVKTLTLTVDSTEERLDSDMNTIRRELDKILGDKAYAYASNPRERNDHWQEQVQQASLTRLVATLVAGLMLGVGLLGLVSMQLANVSNRRYEIALHRALGATRWRQAAEVLFESGLSGLFGGLIGVLLGLGFLKLVINRIGIDLEAPAAWTAGAVLACTVMSLLAGLVPARAALRISPADSLREQ